MSRGGTPGGVLPFATPADFDTAIPRAVVHLRQQGVLAHPTETVYGLGSAIAPDALRALRDLKGRADDKPFVVLVGAIEQIEWLGAELDQNARTLASRFWPGGLTLVVRSGRFLAREVQNAEGAVAVRWTSHHGVAQLLRALGEPMTSTSANAPGLPPYGAASEIVAHWPDAIARRSLLALDGGRMSAGSVPSTIVDCTGLTPRLVRRGAIDPATLRDALPGLDGGE